MKIKREVNGEMLEFELTDRELFNAYCEQEHIWDKKNVGKHLNEGSELCSEMDDLATYVREQINDSDRVNDAIWVVTE